MVKNPPAMSETWVWSLGWEDPLEEGMATHSSILAWRMPRTEEPGRLQSVVSQRVRHGWTTKHIYGYVRVLVEVYGLLSSPQISKPSVFPLGCFNNEHWPSIITQYECAYTHVEFRLNTVSIMDTFTVLGIFPWIKGVGICPLSYINRDGCHLLPG